MSARLNHHPDQGHQQRAPHGGPDQADQVPGFTPVE